MSELTHLKQTYRRHSTPGSLLILAMVVVMFGPRLYDTIRGEPWINNQLTIVENSTGNVVVEDLTFTKEAVNGVRVNTVEGEDSEIICSTEHHNTWHGERKRFWQLEAFTGCPQPTVMYRVCSRFSISSSSGLTRQFGAFCSGLTKPQTKLPTSSS